MKFYTSLFFLILKENWPSNEDSLGDQFHHFDRSLQKFGFDDMQRSEIYTILAGLIYLNMVQFEDDPNAPNCGSMICASSMLAVERVAKLFKFKSNEVTHMLTKRYMRTHNENIE